MSTMVLGCAALGAQILTLLLGLAVNSQAMFYIVYFLQLAAFGVVVGFAVFYMRINLAIRANVD